MMYFSALLMIVGAAAALFYFCKMISTVDGEKKYQESFLIALAVGFVGMLMLGVVVPLLL